MEITPLNLKIPVDLDIKYSDFQEKVLKDILKSVEEKKAVVIKAKLKKMRLSHLLDDYAEQRFKKIVREIRNGEETLWADDGTLNGKRIITFINEFPSFDIETPMVMRYEVKYY